MPYVGPAAALPLLGALARFPHPVAVRIWGGLLAVSFGALVVAALALARTRRVDVLLGAFALAIVAGPTTSDLALGQVALVSAAGIACALVAYERRAVVAGAFATLLAGVQPNLALALIARMRDRVALFSAILGGIAFAALTLIAGGGLTGFIVYLRRLGEHGQAERFVTIQHTPAAITYALGASPGLATAIGTAFAVTAVIAVAFATVRARLDPLAGTLLALAALPFAVPFFHEHDFVVELVPMLVLAVRSRGSARAWAGVATALVLVDWFGLAQRQPAQPQIVAQAIAMACAFAAIGPGTRLQRTDLAALVAVAGISLVAVPLARLSPAPTWPDMLPPAYHAPARADASVVWGDEQRQAGLTAQQPAWGLLRALPLAGCIVLGVAIVVDARRRTSP